MRGARWGQSVGLKQIWSGKEQVLKFRTGLVGTGSQTPSVICGSRGRLEERGGALQHRKGSNWIWAKGSIYGQVAF